jgi:hypothetical protein
MAASFLIQVIPDAAPYVVDLFSWVLQRAGGSTVHPQLIDVGEQAEKHDLCFE